MIYGIRPAIEAIKSGKEIERIMLQQGLRGEGFQELFNLIRELNIPFQYVPPERLNKLTRQNHQGTVTVLSEITYHQLDQLEPSLFESGKNPLLMVLDQITDVRNFGAMVRTAECAGVDAVVIPAHGAAPVNADAIKASAGALFKLPVIKAVNLKEVLHFLKDSGLRIVAANEKANTDFTAENYTLPLTLIMGSEGSGVSEEYLKISDIQVRIPVYGEIGSLNVGVSAGILLYEIIRQRQQKGNA